MHDPATPIRIDTGPSRTIAASFKELSAFFMLVPYSASAGRFRSTFVLGRLDKDHFSDWPGLLPTHRVLFFLTKLPHNKTPQTRLESWDVLLISPPPRSVREERLPPCIRGRNSSRVPQFGTKVGR